VDLVNEQLELIVLRSMGVNIPFVSYQTSGTAEELAAYPEHTYKDANGAYKSFPDYTIVYDSTLKEAVYPNSLPFDLPLAESRTYLAHLGYKRLDVMQRFKPSDADTDISTPGINE